MRWIDSSIPSLATFFILTLTVVEMVGSLSMQIHGSVFYAIMQRTSANTRVFSVPLTGDAFDFDHDDYLLEKYCRLSNPAWVADLQALADQINDAIPGCIVPAIYRIM